MLAKNVLTEVQQRRVQFSFVHVAALQLFRVFPGRFGGLHR